jgi:hypothetical protein
VSRNYTVSQINHILNAYKSLFPSTEGELASYWDYGRTRPWSCITTDFHRVSIETIQAFDAAVRQIGDTGLSHQILGQRFKGISRQYNVGYSLGISPWTDDLLLRTFSERTKFVVIILGHDWYPIVVNAKGKLVVPTPPLQQCSILDDPVYSDAIPNSLCKVEDCAVLFMNLYPDFRPPDSDITGALDNYRKWIKGLEAVCKSISQQYCLVCAISWGEHVWKAVRSHLSIEWQQLGIMAAANRQYKHEQGKPLDLHLGGIRIPYYAFAHPSFGTNFKNESHWAAYESALSTLVLLLTS